VVLLASWLSCGGLGLLLGEHADEGINQKLEDFDITVAFHGIGFVFWIHDDLLASGIVVGNGGVASGGGNLGVHDGLRRNGGVASGGGNLGVHDGLRNTLFTL
jgi:hypothetical protein